MRATRPLMDSESTPERDRLPRLRETTRPAVQLTKSHFGLQGSLPGIQFDGTPVREWAMEAIAVASAAGAARQKMGTSAARRRRRRRR